MKSDADMYQEDTTMPSDAIARARRLPKPISARLPNDATLYIRPEVIDSGGNVGIHDLDFSQVGLSLEGLATVIQDGLKKVKPSKTTVELGFELGLKSGGLIAILCDGSSTASIKVTLEWESDNQITRSE